MKPVPLLFKKMNYGVRVSVIKVKALKDKGDNSSIFMRYIMYICFLPIGHLKLLLLMIKMWKS